jgi:hypothetical protein
LKRLLRTLPATTEVGKQNGGNSRQRRIEITVERETVTVVHSVGRQITQVDREQATKTEPNQKSI